MNFNILRLSSFFIFILLMISCSKESYSPTQNGTSGSLARMISLGDYLYVIDNKTLTTFDVTNPSDPIKKNSTEVGFGIETLFPFANYLFVGSNDGLYIYDITNPDNPVPASETKVEHFTACDPVVANNNYAYVTLNSLRVSCGNTLDINELQIVDITNIQYPYVVNIIEMSGPKGLGIDGQNLFVCDNNLGVIVYDLTNPQAPNSIDTLSGFTANDVIADNGNLLVVGTDGLRQFNYTDINNITLTSFLDLND